MKNRKTNNKKFSLCMLATALLASPLFAQQAPILVNCDSGGKITDALKEAPNGSILEISGTCTESVWVTKDKMNITFDGKSTARLIGPDSTKNPTSPFDFAIFVEGLGITIRNMTIEGGVHGIHLSGPASAVITGNTITGTAGAIHLDKGSIGQIHNNIIDNNKGPAINVQEMSYARIGFQIPTQEQLAPNVITNNDGYAIWIQRWSSAWIAGNEISSGTTHAIVVNRNSQADVIANQIYGNAGDALFVSDNSGVNLTSADSPRAETGNIGAGLSPNLGFAIRCEVDGYVTGPLGSLSGSQATTDFSKGCVNDVTTE